MSKKLVRILSAVNAANVSKSGSTYTIKDVCGAVDDIVMNSVLYPAEQLAAGAATLESKPAPAGHPKNAAGQAISALNGEAMLTSYIGAVCRNARHEGGRTLVDIVVNEKQAQAHPDGVKLVERLDAAISGTNADPIHVSTGLYFEPIATNGEAGGKKYQRIATNLRYDHLAILLNERGAGTPEDGVGMFLNEAGQPEPVEEFTLNVDPEDRRSTGLKAWVLRLVGNGASEVSFDAITSALYSQLPEGAWIRDVFDRYAVWTDRDGKLWRQDYAVSSDASVAFSGAAVEVTREVTYRPITNSQEVDLVKDKILAALNAAGIKTEGLDESALLTAYNALVAKPHVDALTAANSKIAEHEATVLAAQNAERDALAVELATNSSLTADDFKAMPLARLKELKAKAAPVVVGNAGTKPANEMAGYSLNAHLEVK
jgi:hypothetical protein